MAHELITDWHGYHLAVKRLLSIAETSVMIYSGELSSFKLESAENLASIERLLNTTHSTTIQIALRDDQNWQTTHPRLARLFINHSHLVTIRQAPSEFSHLRDSMLIVDHRHSLIRFEQNLARSKLLLDESPEVRPYIDRFLEICEISGQAFSFKTLGL